jgi:hypothetical protein
MPHLCIACISPGLKSGPMITYILLWFPMLVLAIINGLIRELLLRKFVGKLRAHQLSTVTLIIFFAVYIWFIMKRFPPASGTMAILVGLVWVLMTLCFEFGFGRYRGNSWATLLEDYNLFKGRLWILIPAWVLVAPFLFYNINH